MCLDWMPSSRIKGKHLRGTQRFVSTVLWDETISTEDAEVRASDLPSVAVDGTRNRWARLSAPDTPGVYYYGICIEGVADESDTENNCSTAVKMTVGTPVATDPDTSDQPSQGTSLAEQVFEKHSRILQRQDVKEVLPDVLISLKEPDIQALLNPATIELVLADPDLLKKTVPTISDKFITLMKTDAEIKTLLSDAQVQTLLRTPAAIDELARLAWYQYHATTHSKRALDAGREFTRSSPKNSRAETKRNPHTTSHAKINAFGCPAIARSKFSGQRSDTGQRSDKIYHRFGTCNAIN